MPSVLRPRFFLLLLYATYLAYAGLFFLLAPWTEAWTTLVMRLPLPIAVVLSHPALKGMISTFGLLHFLLALVDGTIGLRSTPREEPRP